MDLLFVHFATRSLVLRLIDCFSLVVDRSLLFGHSVLFSFLSLYYVLYISTTIQIEHFQTGPERSLHSAVQ